MRDPRPNERLLERAAVYHRVNPIVARGGQPTQRSVSSARPHASERYPFTHPAQIRPRFGLGAALRLQAGAHVATSVRPRAAMAGRWIAALAGLGCWCIAASAWGQSAADAATAETLFAEGRRLLQDGEIDRACDKLEASQRLDSGMGTLFHLADCYERLGRTASAWTSFLELAAWAKKELRLDREKVARERAAALEPRLSRLTVVVPQATRLDGLTIKQGSVVLDPASWDTALPIDPGTVRITAEAPGHLGWVSQLEVPAGAKSVAIRVPVLERKPSVATEQARTARVTVPQLAPPDPRLDHAQSPWTTARTWGWVAGGVGVVGVGLGSYLGLRAFAKMDESDRRCQDGCSVRGAQLSDQARKSADLSTVSFAVGVAGLAAGAYLLFVHDSGDAGSRPSSSTSTGSMSSGSISSGSMSSGRSMASLPILVDLVAGSDNAKLSLGGTWY